MEEIKENLQNIEEVERTILKLKKIELEIKINFRVLKNIEKTFNKKALEVLSDFEKQFIEASIEANKNEEIEDKKGLFEVIDYLKLIELLYCVQSKFDNIDTLFDNIVFSDCGSIFEGLREEMGKRIIHSI